MTSSSSSESGASDSTAPSSAPSELATRLPTPFYPPSLSKRPLAEIDANNEIRSITKKHAGLPNIPLEEQVVEIAPDDK